MTKSELPNATSTSGTEYAKILVCPVTRGPLIYSKETNELISEKAQLAFPIIDGIPEMNPKHAKKITSEKKSLNTSSQ